MCNRFYLWTSSQNVFNACQYNGGEFTSLGGLKHLEVFNEI